MTRYIVELEKGVWLRYWYGKPVTTAIENAAKRFRVRKDPAAAMRWAKNNGFKGARIVEIEVEG